MGGAFDNWQRALAALFMILFIVVFTLVALPELGSISAVSEHDQ